MGDFEFATSMDYLGAKMAEALEEHPQSWFVSALASLYWRVSGDFGEAAECLRHALYFAPADVRDVGYLGLASIFHNAGLYNDALVVAQQAYEISGRRHAAVPFAMAEIYRSMVRFACKSDALLYLLFRNLTKTITSVGSKFVQVTAVLCLENWHSLPH